MSGEMALSGVAKMLAIAKLNTEGCLQLCAWEIRPLNFTSRHPTSITIRGTGIGAELPTTA
eukprot:2883586-Rhodomonas_salina.3